MFMGRDDKQGRMVRARQSLVRGELILAIMSDVLAPHWAWYQRSLAGRIDGQLGAQQPLPRRDEASIPTMPRGSALVRLQSVTRRGGANRSNLPRAGLILNRIAHLICPSRIATTFHESIGDLSGDRSHQQILAAPRARSSRRCSQRTRMRSSRWMRSDLRKLPAHGQRREQRG